MRGKQQGLDRQATCRSGGNAAAGRAMMGPTSFRAGGSGRGCSSAMSAFTSVSDSSRRAAADVRSMSYLRLIRHAARTGSIWAHVEKTNRGAHKDELEGRLFLIIPSS